ncbi:MAG: inositol-3-phosphate synthase, partial [Acidobacteria bacterium]|nr:inositol-3-phosphate synthase [Acidobacteriota bacterium]
MSKRQVGLWLVGAFGGVGTTVALGLASLRRGLVAETGLVTGLPMLRSLDLDDPETFILGGHDIRRTSFEQTIREFQQRSNVFAPVLVDSCLPQLRSWAENIRPGTVYCAGETIAQLAELPETRQPETPKQTIDRLKADLLRFRDREKLDQLVVVNVASTEPPFPVGEVHE